MQMKMKTWKCSRGYVLKILIRFWIAVLYFKLKDTQFDTDFSAQDVPFCYSSMLLKPKNSQDNRIRDVIKTQIQNSTQQANPKTTKNNYFLRGGGYIQF